MPSCKESSWPRDWTCISYISPLAGRFLTSSATWEARFIRIGSQKKPDYRHGESVRERRKALHKARGEWLVQHPGGFWRQWRSQLSIVSGWEKGCWSIYLHLHVSLWFRAISRGEGSESPGALSFSYIQSKADFSSLKEAQQKFRAGY